MSNSYLFILSLIFLVQVTTSQGQDTIRNVFVEGCEPVSPSNSSFDSSSYTLIGQDSLEIIYISFQQMCFQPLVTQKWENDTSKISIQDTASGICLADCYIKIRFRIPFLSDTLGLQIGNQFFHLIKADLVDVHKVEVDPNFVKAYPNPVEKHFLLSFKKRESFTLKLFSINGNLILSKKVTQENLIHLNMEAFHSGIYIFQIQGEDYIRNMSVIKT